MLLCQRWTPLNDNNNSSTTAATTGSSTSWVWPNLILNSNTNTNSNSKLNLNPRRMQMTIKSKLIDCHLSLSHLLLTHRLLKLICRLRPIWVYKEKEKKNAVKNTKSFCPYTALEFSLIIIGSVTPTSPRGALPSWCNMKRSSTSSSCYFTHYSPPISGILIFSNHMLRLWLKLKDH